MSFEIEQKFPVESHAAIARELAALGAQAGPTLEQEDAYLGHPSRDFAQTNEALRLRRVGDRNAITYKGPRLAGPTKTRREYEIDFAPGAATLAGMRAVFEGLGFRPVATVRKVRTPYHLTYQGRDVEVVLDRVEGLGDYVEVEAIAASGEEVAETQEIVLGLARALGLTAPEPRSYLRMLLEKIQPPPNG